MDRIVDCVGVEGRKITAKDKNNALRKLFNFFQVEPFYKGLTQNFYVFYCNHLQDIQLKSEYFTKVFVPLDPKSKNFTDAIKRKIVGLSRQNTRELI